MGKEPELVREFEKLQLDIYSASSPRIARASEPVFTREFVSVSEMVACLRFWVGGQIWTVVCTYGPNSSSDSFLESLKGVLQTAPSGGSLVFLSDFNAHVGSDSET